MIGDIRRVELPCGKVWMEGVLGAGMALTAYTMQ